MNFQLQIRGQIILRQLFLYDKQFWSCKGKYEEQNETVENKPQTHKSAAYALFYTHIQIAITVKMCGNPYQICRWDTHISSALELLATLTGDAGNC